MSTPPTEVPAQRVCDACGATASRAARYCPSCGTRLPEFEPAQATVGAVQRPWGEPPPPPAAPEPSSGVPWRAIEALPVFLIHLLVAAVVGVPLVLGVETENARAVGLVLASEVALLGVTLLWLNRRYGVGLAGVGLRALTGSNVGIGLLAGLGGLAVSIVMTAAIGGLVESITGEPVPQPEQIPISGEPSTALLWLLGVGVVVLAPIAEEVFFRGMLFAGLRRWAAPWPAVLLSSVIFGITHVIPIVILPIAALGVLLAWLVEKRRSLVPAIVAHMTFNAVGFWAGFVVDSGSF